MKKKTKKILLIIFSLLIICASFVLLYYNFINNSPKEEPALQEIIVKEEDKKEVVVEEKETILMSPDVDLEKERINRNNNEIVGRLEIPNLFNILIVRGTDNSFYLEHAIDNKKYDYRGSEFLDYRLDVNSKQLNFYGHNSIDKNINVPFLKLEQFLDKTFFDNNQYIIFQFDGGKKIYKIAAIKEITTDYEHMNVFYTGSDFVNHLNILTSDTIYKRDVPYDANSEIIVLQTCSHHLKDAYYVITGIRIK